MSDDEVVIEVIKEVTPELVEAWVRLMPQLSSRATPPTQEWLQQIVDSGSQLFMAKLDGHYVGSLTLSFTKIPVGLRAWIDDVVVDESVRGRGIGELLSSSAIAAAEASDVREIKLTSDPARIPAHKLYQRLGFEQRESRVYRYKQKD